MNRLISFILILISVPTYLFSGNSLKPHFFKGSFEEAKTLAREEGKLFMLSFYAEWCTPCNWMDETTFADSTVQQLLHENYISFKVDIDNNEGFQLKEKYELRYLPTIMIFNTQSKLLLRIEETLSPGQMIRALEKYNSEENRLVIQHAMNSSPLERKELEGILLESSISPINSNEITNKTDQKQSIENPHRNTTLIFLPPSIINNENHRKIEKKDAEDAVQKDNSKIANEKGEYLADLKYRKTPESSSENLTQTDTQLNSKIEPLNTLITIDESPGSQAQITKVEHQAEIVSESSDAEKSILNSSDKKPDDSLGNFEYQKKVDPQYKLQIGVFSQFKNTYKIVNDLKDKFEEPVIVMNDSKHDQIIYRVFLGAFYTIDEAEDFQRMLKRKYQIESVVK